MSQAVALPVIAYVVLALFNLPVVAVFVGLPLKGDLKQALKEKTAVGGATDTTSYSRVTGLLGAVIVTSFFWAVGNLIIYKAFTQPDDIKLITDNVGRFFLVGAALFLPYAFNQIKAAFGADEGNADPGGADTAGANQQQPPSPPPPPPAPPSSPPPPVSPPPPPPLGN